MGLLVRVFLLSLLLVSSLAQLPSQDILALLAFKKGITHDPTGFIADSWNEESIDFNGCPSSWNGIVCNGANVAGVILDNRGISGIADLSVFANLTMLVKLSMADNNFSGSLPANLGDLRSLKYLDVSNNGFSGQLPEGVGKLQSLQNLSLAGNDFSGPLPDSIGGLSSLQSLDLSRNSFSGPLPDFLKSLRSLVSLNLSYNAFTKEIPSGLGMISTLEYVDMSWNQLDGSVDWKFLVESSVIHVDFSGNSLTTANPKELKALAEISETVKYLNLSNNQLSGTLIDGVELSTFGRLKVLDLSNNQLSGDLPGFNYVYDLEVLRLGNNAFTGFVPSGLLKDNTLVLSELDLSANNLSGSCTTLDLSSNQFGGNLSVIAKWANDLEYIDLSQNQLTGSFPEVLNLSGNRFNGSFPDDLGSLTGLQVLDLSANNFSEKVSDKSAQRKSLPETAGGKGEEAGGGASVVSADDLRASRKGSTSEMITPLNPEEKLAAIGGYSPSKNSRFSWSPESGETYVHESLGKLDVRSPDKLAGELHFLDETITLTPEELSRAPAEVLGRSSHGTSYRATLDNGVFLTVKWLREGVAKPKKEFSKEARKFANIRHPNVVGLRGYYWGPTQHEKLILSDYVSPGSLASFLYDRPGRRGPSLTWAQRLKIAVDVARGLNYLHFDRAIPHGNLKATNILLDGLDLNARVADYCLHRLMTQSGTVEQILDSGVLGYRAPELAASKKPSPSFKSDVYAFGVILLELLTGKCAGDVISGEEGGIDLTDWVRLRVAEGRGSDCFDPVMASDLANSAASKGMKEVLGIALRCIRPISERPGIKSVYEDLSSI
ncbi:putative LRR receptor-like serine/threonine-protein kinase [Ananas comosus]|uniref:Putative LRR receptor-like serine/threonine-protein kinase n=1 Tax=Ananas comosus TaxID=4615 RepID=A0A199W2K2_ANACO|nr:putative LRR receptor-like serine/threonine-protein kinase [Ananas comosus]